MQVELPSRQELEQVIRDAQAEIIECQQDGAAYAIDDPAENAARAYALLGDDEQARRYFTQAAWANLEKLERAKAQGRDAPEDQWRYIFAAFWLYYKAGQMKKMGELVRELDALMPLFPPPFPLLRQIQITLAHYVLGDVDTAKLLYTQLGLADCVDTPYHPEVKIIQTGLFGDSTGAQKALTILQHKIATENVRPWYANRLDFDLVELAERLLGEA